MAQNDKPPAVLNDCWSQATPKQKETALLRQEFIQPIVEHQSRGGSLNVIIKNLLLQIEGDCCPQRLCNIALALGRNSKPPGRSTIINWVNQYQQQGINGLLDKHTGRVRKERGWEMMAAQLYNIPSKPSFTAVAAKLREMGHDSATDSAVRRYLKSLPATLNSNSPARLGKHWHHQNRSRYTMRDETVLLVGEVYEGDGHTVDCYIAHPGHGGPWRPELTVWIDVRSRYITGWYLSEAESTTSTLFALSHALTSHDHVPAWLHIDNGSGYKAKLMCDESTGFYSRFNMQTTFSIPGNSRGKGLVEHWFRTFRDHHDKFFNGGADYCGHDMAEEVNRRLTDSIRQGKRQLRSFYEYRDSIEAFIQTYNQRGTKTLNGLSPAEVWQGLERVPVELSAAAVVRPMVERVAQRCTVRLDNRHYEHPCLVNWEGKKVHVEYDLHTDNKVWIFDEKGRLICEAPLKTKVAWLPESRLDEARGKREAGRIKRLEKKIALVKAEEANQIDQNDVLDGLENFNADEIVLPADANEKRLIIDVHEDDYLNESNEAPFDFFDDDQQ